MSGRLEIRIAGTGGQGLILAARMLAQALSATGRRVAQSQTYEPTSRGGYCNSDLVVTQGEADYPLATALDGLVLLDRLALAPSWPLLKKGSLVIADAHLELPDAGHRIHRLPLVRTALELGSERVANMVALGALAGLAGLCERNVLEHTVREETPKSYLDLNLEALGAGYRLGGQAKAVAAAS